ncbi:tryptophan-rich sensory protein [Hoyosella rhizosphaerae]|nr:TspO/MBR family protein [Hoyosella rhizosphaerae]MBN4926681.1 tryptophan-rich sensory protein [Hoyosella rhizosphaerae]
MTAVLDDRARASMRFGVIAAILVAVAAAFVGAGRIGERSIADAGDGVLGETGTLVAPASAAFGIWTVIYIGLIAYAVWQALPGQKRSYRQKQLRPLAAASMILNGAWLVSAVMDQLLVSVFIMLMLLTTLIAIMGRLLDTCPESRAERVIVDGTFGLYLGWVALATFANITAWLVSIGIDAEGTTWGATFWSVIALSLVTVVGVALAWITGGRTAPAIALVWGLGWIAYARFSGELVNATTASTALAAAVTIGVITVLVRLPTGPRLS